MKKKINIIYPAVLLCIIAAVLILSTKIKNEEKENETVSTSNEKGSDMVAGEEATYTKEEIDAIEKAKKTLASGRQNENLKGQYEDRPHSVMINPQNITEEYVFLDPLRLVQFEIIAYEELNDLSQYDTSIDPKDTNKCFDYGFTSEYSIYTTYRKVINEDGTLNPIVNVTKERLLDGVYGDVVKEDENHWFKPVKITVRISNTTQVSQELDVFDSWRVSLQKFITMDDGNTYLYDSLYNETFSNVGLPIYCSAKNKYEKESFAVPEFIRVGGNESVEVSYIFMIDDSEDISYIVMTIPEEMETSYYANFVKYYSLNNLKQLESDGR